MSKRKWEEDLFKDFDALVEVQKRGENPVNVTLPSGRRLHNPAKRTVKSASRWASQQVDNAVAASADWLDGVKNPSRPPLEAAKDAIPKWEDAMDRAIKEKRMEKGLAKSSQSEIVAIAEAVGEGGYRTGVEARRGKVSRVVGELQPLMQALSDSIQAMSDKTDSDREKRLISARKLMIEVGRKRRG